MVLLSIFQTVEFYVITAFLAAAVVGAVAMPQRKGAARNFLYAGTLRADATPSQPGIVALVTDAGALEIHRFGLEEVDMSGAYSLAVTIIGFDVTVDERLTPGRLREGDATAAMAVLDCLGAERYHFHYRSEATGRSCAFSLNIRPGNRIERLLS
ncbi:MAG: hypothetical protein NC418_01270 [Muribaculaceae bacterium]|nr:hypothetical protein [Muribaculaceae bacterium]